MIIVRLMGGLGNQMFQYAAGRRLAEKNHTELRLDLTLFDQMAARDTPRHYELNCYEISGRPASTEELGRMLPLDFQAGFFYKVWRRLGLDRRLRPFGEPGKYYSEIFMRVRDNSYLTGWWQNEKYFKDIREILLKEFTPKKISGQTKKLEQQISADNSVSIHVRRGDYVSNQFAKKTHGGLATVDYYKQAIAHINQRLDKPAFYFFSDDLDWCRRNLPLGKGAIFVSGNAGRAYEDIYLMSKCRHNIIANSSFSWWGAWLNRNPSKIVTTPKRWFRDEETEIVPEGWVRL